MTLFIAKLFLLWVGLSMIVAALLCRFFQTVQRDQDDRPNRLE